MPLPLHPASPCSCLADDAAASRAALRRAHQTDTLIDESHFLVSIRHCAACAQQFLCCFCEQVDWADSDDPQAWVYIPLTDTEAATLRALPQPASESDMLKITATPRRFLLDLAPKGAPRTIDWITRVPYIPGHD